MTAELELEEWDLMLEAFADRIRKALAEAGYPDADVTVEPTGVFVEGPPEPIVLRAVEISGGTV